MGAGGHRWRVDSPVSGHGRVVDDLPGGARSAAGSGPTDGESDGVDPPFDRVVCVKVSRLGVTVKSAALNYRLAPQASEGVNGRLVTF